MQSPEGKPFVQRLLTKSTDVMLKAKVPFSLLPCYCFSSITYQVFIYSWVLGDITVLPFGNRKKNVSYLCFHFSRFLGFLVMIVYSIWIWFVKLKDRDMPLARVLIFFVSLVDYLLISTRFGRAYDQCILSSSNADVIIKDNRI